MILILQFFAQLKIGGRRGGERILTIFRGGGNHFGGKCKPQILGENYLRQILFHRAEVQFNAPRDILRLMRLAMSILRVPLQLALF